MYTDEGTINKSKFLVNMKGGDANTVVATLLVAANTIMGWMETKLT